MWKKIEPYLVADWKESWKWLSVHVALLLTIIAGIDIHSGPVAQLIATYVPVKYQPFIGLAVFLAARLVNQGKQNKAAP